MRWVNGKSGVHLEGLCDAVPAVVGPPAGICFTMPMWEVPVYSDATVSSTLLVTLVPEGYAAVVGRTTGGWARLDLAPGNTGLAIQGWVLESSLNVNGPCDKLPLLMP